MSTAFSSLFRSWSELSPRKRIFLMILGLCSAVWLLSWAAPRPGQHQTWNKNVAGSAAVSNERDIDAEMKAQWERLKLMPKTVQPLPAPSAGRISYGPGEAGNFAEPMIAHAAELSVGTKEFAKARSGLEEILERHHGYAAKLRMLGQPSGGMLTATLRVPSSEFNAAVEDLKRLGNVEREEQTADEITRQRADLEARLANADSTRVRLQGVLAKGGKQVGNLAEIQRQLAAVDEEIARLEAERLSAEHRVTFAQVLFSLHEAVTPPVESFAAEFRAAAMSGLTEVAGSLSALLFFAVSRGPMALIWAVVIYFPVRWAWRKWQTAEAVRQTGLASGA
jgi:hypothetical protein